jgi:hypothetical protein
MKKFLLFILVVFAAFPSYAQDTYTLSGYVKEGLT